MTTTLQDYLLSDDAIFDLMVSKAGESTPGGLITAGEIVSSVRKDSPIAAFVKILFEPIPKDSIVLRAYFNSKKNDYALSGDRLCSVDGKASLFGCPIPKGIPLGFASEEAGQEGSRYQRPFATLMVPGEDDENISLQVPLQAQKGNYYEWCEAFAVAKKKSELLGTYSEPALLGDRVRLDELAAGIYKIKSIEEEQKTSKAGNAYTAITYVLEGATGEVTTFPSLNPYCLQSRGLGRLLKSGKTMFLVCSDPVPSVDRDGNQKYYDNIPQMQINGFITPQPPTLESVLATSRKVEVMSDREPDRALKSAESDDDSMYSNDF